MNPSREKNTSHQSSENGPSSFGLLSDEDDVVERERPRRETLGTIGELLAVELESSAVDAHGGMLLPWSPPRLWRREPCGTNRVGRQVTPALGSVSRSPPGRSRRSTPSVAGRSRRGGRRRLAVSSPKYERIFRSARRSRCRTALSVRPVRSAISSRSARRVARAERPSRLLGRQTLECFREPLEPFVSARTLAGLRVLPRHVGYERGLRRLADFARSRIKNSAIDRSQRRNDSSPRHSKRSIDKYALRVAS